MGKNLGIWKRICQCCYAADVVAVMMGHPDLANCEVLIFDKIEYRLGIASINNNHFLCFIIDNRPNVVVSEGWDWVDF